MKPRQPYLDDYDEPLGSQSIYDGDESETDPWFLPDPEAALADHEIPLPMADRVPLNTVASWLEAQGQHAAQLAQAALTVGQLDMLVGEMGQGALERLALREVEALTWAVGSPISLDELGRDQLQARAGTDLENLQSARWAVRRLASEGAQTDLRKFLGLHRTPRADSSPDTRLRLAGQEFDEAEREFHTARSEVVEAHCFVQAAYERHLWRLADLSPEEDRFENAVWSACRLASDCASLTFVPIGQGARRLRGTGPQELGNYLVAIAQGVEGAKSELLRLRRWAEAAREATATIKGETPARIIDALVSKPLCSTEMVEREAGVSRDTAERLLKRLNELGVVREVTGGARFRLWASGTGSM